MSINDFSLPDLIEYAKSELHEDAVNALLDRVNASDIQELRAAASQFDALFDTWDDAIVSSLEKAELCVKLAELSILDSENFRNSLNYAVRKLLPPYLVSHAVVKALGAKDANIGVREVAMRLKKLQHMRSTAVIYQQETRQCGRINSIDRVTGTIAVTPFDGASISSVPISSAVVTSFFFETTPELLNLLYPMQDACRPSTEYRRVLHKLALSDIPDIRIMELVQHIMVPSIFTQADFNTWWEATPVVPSANGKRAFGDSRSVLELFTLLKPARDEGVQVKVDPESAEKLKKLFMRVSTRLLPKDVQMLAESISCLANGASSIVLAPMFAPLRSQVPFWPADVTNIPSLLPLEIWGKIAVKNLEGLLAATRMIYSKEEYVHLGLLLPIRCMSVFFEQKKKGKDESPKETEEREANERELVQSIITEIASMKSRSADVCLWIWKNRTRIRSKIICSLVDMETVTAALNHQNLPKEWYAAQRELKRLLDEKQEFHQFLLDNADGDIPSIISGIEKYRVTADRQSIMVKMARLSSDLKDYLESGEGSKLIGRTSTETAEKPPVTSIASHKRMIAELKDLVDVQIPQNAAAVAYARSFGDLRENAEYDAAKERRRFLHKRRADLEKTLAFIESTDFKDVKTPEIVVPGCQVILKNDKNKKLSYFILGAWDGDPERSRISYKAPIGQVLIHHKPGDKVNLPELGLYTIDKLEALPADMIKELSAE